MTSHQKSDPSRSPPERVTLAAEVPENLAGKRLDQTAAHLFPDFSRARLQQWIKRGELRVNGRSMAVSGKVYSADRLELDAEIEAVQEWAAQVMPLHLVYEDEDLLVLNKPEDTVVHPAAGHREGTLLNGLLHHCPQLERIPRAGIVHRLDKDTTGLLVVAKTLAAHHDLVKQLQARHVSREYRAVVQGVMTAGGTVDAPLGRHPVKRQKRAVVSGGKEALTRYRVLERYRYHCLLQLNLETGRTHQIRVHMAYLKHPIVGDPLYGRLQIPGGCSDALAEHLRNFRRQALHALRLEFLHPRSGERLSFEAPPPADMQTLIDLLRADAAP